MRRSLLNIANILIYRCYVHPVLNRLETRHSREKAIESLFTMLEYLVSQTESHPLDSVTVMNPSLASQITEAIREMMFSCHRRFLKDFGIEFGLQEQLHEIISLKLSYDGTRYSYIVKVLNDLCGPFDSLAFSSISNKKKSAVSSEQKDESLAISQIRVLKEMFPHFGEDFIASLLEYFHYDSEATIHSILEKRIPNSITQLDRSIETSVVRKQPEENSNHRNHFSNGSGSSEIKEVRYPSKIHWKGFVMQFPEILCYSID